MSRLNDLRRACLVRRLTLIVRTTSTTLSSGIAAREVEVFIHTPDALEVEPVTGPQALADALEVVRKRWPAKNWDTRRARQRAVREQTEREGRRQARQARTEAEYRMARGVV